MKKIYLFCTLILFIGFGNSSCGGDDTDPTPKDDGNQVVPQNARVGFANGSDGIVKGSFSISSGIASQLAPGKNSNMADVLEGSHTIIVKNGDNNMDVYNQSLTLKKKNAYDFFLSGNRVSPAVVLIEQSFTVPDKTKAYVQCVNLINDSKSNIMKLERMDVGGQAPMDIGAAMAYKSYSGMIALFAGTYKTDIVDGSGGPKPDQTPKSQILEAGKVYQVYSYREGNRIQSVFKLTSSFE